MINELIEQLQTKAGLTNEQANAALQTIKQYVVEKFPMLAGAVDNIFPSAAPATTSSDVTTNAATPSVKVVPHAPVTPETEPSFLDKISDFIPGQTGEKIEEFAKKAAHGAGDLFNKK